MIEDSDPFLCFVPLEQREIIHLHSDSPAFIHDRIKLAGYSNSPT